MRRALGLLLLVVAVGCGGGDDARDDGAAPVDQTNRWAVVAPADEGVDAGRLARADREARERLVNVTSVLVARHGRLVFERYYRGAAGNARVPVFSITKSVISALVGIAVRDGKLTDLGRPVVTYLPDVAPLVIDDRARRITVFPSLDLVVVVTSHAAEGAGAESADLIYDFVVPAVRANG